MSGHPASGNSQKEVKAMMAKQVTTIAEKKDATKVAKSQLDSLSLRMTVALLRRAVADQNADSDLLFRVADLACQAFRDLAQAAKEGEAKQRLWRAWHSCWWALKWADEGLTDLVRSAFEDAIASVVT
jgi:hypothetical protein